VTITSSVLANLATAQVGFGSLSPRSVSESYRYQREGTERHVLAHKFISGEAISFKGLLLKPADKSWCNIKGHLTTLHSSYTLVAWEESYLGCIDGILFGVTCDGILASVLDPDTETFLEIKSGHKPTGQHELEKWARENKERHVSPLPTNELAAHVLQVNLQRYAREQERIKAGCTVRPSIMQLLYGSTRGAGCQLFELPPMYVVAITMSCSYV
jgi:hypothetical protein